ncbi:unnamed protein product [Auanema sp. JU1783]|nr:unnamed protein product [Auanema sp. JU1783]
MAEEYQLVRTFASLPRTTRGLPVVIGVSPKGDKILYPNGNSVFTVPVKDVTNPDIYTEHSVPVTVAKMSPSGFYCASGDANGNVRIWDTVNSTHILKATYPVFHGNVRDIAWNDDSKRLAVVGEGRERFGHVFLFDTGTSNGNLSGQSRPMGSIDFRPTRPFRLISGSEDNTVAIFEGPPFKFKTTLHEHTRFVHAVRYNPDGSLFASAGADGKVIVYEGAEGKKEFELSDESCKGNAHSGSVFGVSWSSDGTRLATASADKTLKIWNVPNKSLEKTVTFGDEIDNQQLSAVWAENKVVTVALNGFISIVNPDEGSIEKVITGHNKPITAAAVTDARDFLFTADFEGNINRWKLSDGSSLRLPKVHKSQVVGLFATSSGTLISTGWDDAVAFTGSATGSPSSPKSVQLPSQPLGLASSSDGKTVAVACYKHVVIIEDGKVKNAQSVDGQPSCVAFSEEKKLVAVGLQSSNVVIYGLDSNGTLTEKKRLSHNGHITAVSFSANSEYLVASDNARKVIPYKVADDFSVASSKEWTFHLAKVNCAAWSPNGRYVATGGLDTNLIVWDTQNSGEHPIIIKGAHAMSSINEILWTKDNELLTIGQDSNIKHWRLHI